MAVNKRGHKADETQAGPGGIETMTVANTAQAYLSLLGARGADYFFANGGTDFASIIDAFARLTAEGRPVPKPVTVPHEMVAASMAHSYYLVSAGGSPCLELRIRARDDAPFSCQGSV